jgi:hypothetical protein
MMAPKMTLLEAMSIASSGWANDAEHVIFLEARNLVRLHGRLFMLERLEGVREAEIASLKEQIGS